MARALLALLLASLTVTVDRPVVMPGEVVTVTIAGYEPGLMFIDTTDELVVLETTKASGSITMRAQIAADAPLYEAGLLEQRYKLLGAMLVFNPRDREAIREEMDQTLLKIHKHQDRWPTYPDEFD